MEKTGEVFLYDDKFGQMGFQQRPIIKSGLPNDRRAKFLPSVVGFAYDLLRYECYLGNIGLTFVGCTERI